MSYSGAAVKSYVAAGGTGVVKRYESAACVMSYYVIVAYGYDSACAVDG